MGPHNPKYRPDIDGLRGISVVAVVLFHARTPGFGGGYVGVDVFFVISGFLITSIIIHPNERNFGVVSFYERRVRRLFPALFAVLVSCAAMSVFLSLPNVLDRFGQSLISTSLFVPNILFWRQAGYFSSFSENAPLLHLWSLGVEEQFYIFFPAMLVIIRRIAEKHAIMIIAILACASFLLSIWAVEHHPVAAFYLTPTRAWELLFGALLSMRALPPLANIFLRESSTLLGLLLIGWSILNLSGESAFPGLNALIPCFGAALIVYAGDAGQTLVTRALAVRPLVFVGLISYSLYLWHWPLLSFARMYSIRHLDTIETVSIIIFAVLISTLSWKFVEQPFRKRGGVWKRQGLFKAAAFMVISTIALGITFTATDGLPQRVSPTVHLFEQGSKDTNPFRENCHQISPSRIRAGLLCRLGDWSSGDPDYIVWGDSHADAMMPAFAALSEENGSRGLFASSTSCPPLVGLRVRGSGEVEDCKDFNDAMLSLIEQHESAAVILVAYWSIYLDSGLLITDTEIESNEENNSVFSTGLSRTLSSLSRANRKIWLVQQVPVSNFDPPSTLAMAEHRGFDRDILRLSARTHNASTRPVNEIFDRARKQYHYRLVNPQDTLCDQSHCNIEFDGKSLYRDYHHISTFGALHIKPSLKRIFADQGSGR